MNLTDLETFVRVADTGSYSGAAAVLGVPVSTVSRRIARLEDALGLPLVVRSGRSLTLTEHARLVHRRARPALIDLGELASALVDTREVPQGELRITAPEDLGATRPFARMLSAFREKWPGITLDLDLTSRVLDLVAESVDVAFRPELVARNAPTGLMMRSVGTLEAGLYASPGYLALHGTPADLAGLAGHRILTHRSRRLVGFAGAPASCRIVVATSALTLLRRLCLNGDGIATLPVFLAREDADAGTLVRVLPAEASSVGKVMMVWPEARYLTPRVRTFLDFVSEWADARGLFAPCPGAGPAPVGTSAANG